MSLGLLSMLVGERLKLGCSRSVTRGFARFGFELRPEVGDCLLVLLEHTTLIRMQSLVLASS